MNVDQTLDDRRAMALRVRTLRALEAWRVDRANAAKSDAVLKALIALRDSLPEA